MKLIGTVLLLTAGCALGAPQSTRSQRPNSKPRLKFSIADSIVDFAVNLSTGRPREENLIFSPFSITSVLNMLLLGAEDNTYQQLREVLRYPFIEDHLIHQQSAAQLRALERTSSGVTVNISNRLFIDETFGILPEYKEEIRAFYQADAETVNFTGKPIVTKRRINKWCADNTNNLIPELLSEPVSGQTSMMAINVVYFNSSWQTQFDPAKTKKEKFNVSPTEIVDTDMMHATMQVPYAKFDRADPTAPDGSNKRLKFKVIGIPYLGGSHAFYVVLPNEVGAEPLEKLESLITSKTLDDVLSGLAEREVEVSLPRFKMTYSLQLTNILQEMGARDIFTTAASLGRMSTDRGLFISDILHQAVIDVHERGTEAAAATTSLVSRGSFTTKFNINRPFLFFIRDNQTGVPLFWGKLVRPGADTESVTEPPLVPGQSSRF